MTDPAPDTSDEHRFPCPQCGSDLRFDPGADRLVCDHCGHSEPIESGPWEQAAAIRELDFLAALRAALPAQDIEQTRAFKCTGCGALIEIGEATHATECPYCATPVVGGTGTHRQIKPRGVLPFALPEDTARQAMIDWLGRLWFAPNGVQQYARKGRRLTGIYMPYWTFDADTETRYTGSRGTEHSTGHGKERRTEIRWTRVSGRVARFFDDVLVVASHALPERFRGGLGQWDLAALEPYRADFLAGFQAEAYTIDLEGAYEEARRIMDRQIRRDIKFDIGGDRQRIHSADTTVRDVTFKHILLPVWMAAYTYRGKSYRFAVNGRTGQVVGERPWSAWKIAVAVVLGAILAGAIGYAIALNQ